MKSHMFSIVLFSIVICCCYAGKIAKVARGASTVPDESVVHDNHGLKDANDKLIVEPQIAVQHDEGVVVGDQQQPIQDNLHSNTAGDQHKSATDNKNIKNPIQGRELALISHRILPTISYYPSITHEISNNLAPKSPIIPSTIPIIPYPYVIVQ